MVAAGAAVPRVSGRGQHEVSDVQMGFYVTDIGFCGCQRLVNHKRNPPIDTWQQI
jgi:hypothetical protein